MADEDKTVGSRKRRNQSNEDTHATGKANRGDAHATGKANREDAHATGKAARRRVQHGEDERLRPFEQKNSKGIHHRLSDDAKVTPTQGWP